MSTSQNDGETTPRPDAKETSDAKETQLANRIDRLLDGGGRAEDRKRETRRKIIIGGVMLLEADKNVSV